MAKTKDPRKSGKKRKRAARKPRGKGGVWRVQHVPTDATRAQVEALIAFDQSDDGAGHYAAQVDIARYLGIDPKTLRKHYGDILERGRTTLKIRIADNLVGMAFGRPARYDAAGNVVRTEIPADKTLVIFLAKTVLRLRETNRLEIDDKRADLSKLTDKELDAYERLTAKATGAEDSAGDAGGYPSGTSTARH